MNLLLLKLFNLVSLFFNVSKFIKIFSTNKLDKDFCSILVNTYLDSCNTDLYIYANNFKEVFGFTSEGYIIDSVWDNIYFKIIQDYADTYNECISSQQQVSVFHKLWTWNTNLTNSWISASNNNILNLLTSITLLNYDIEYVVIEFKHFKSVKLFSGETITFPSNFEYSYKVNAREQDIYILFSQLVLNSI